jgi:alkylation response protein AidB-like acyl-CoA dehydrogenase
MQEDSTDSQAMREAFRDSARDFLTRESTLARLRQWRDSTPGFERDMWRKIAGMGWTGMLVPEALGGLGLGLREFCAIAQEIGRNPLPEPVLAVAVQAVSVLLDLPSSDLRDCLLRELAAGETIAGLAWQEATQGIEFSVPEALVSPAGGGLLLDGAKRWVYPGAGADGWLVTCLQEGEPALYWLPAETRGVALQTHYRVDGSAAATLRFERAELLPAHCLARGAAVAHAVQRANRATRVAQSAELLGVARHAYAMTLDYLKTRVQFGRPIGANQALQHRMVDAYLQIELAEAVLNDETADAGEACARFPAWVSRLKSRCSQAALRVTRQAIQFHGAIGYTDELDVGLYLKRALHLCAWLGGVEQNRSLAWRDLRGLAEGGETPRAAHSPEPSQADARADWNAMPESEFRARVRSFIQGHYPAALRNPAQRLHWADLKDWYLALSRKGWLAPAWPKAHGGMALAPARIIAMMEEMEAHGVARTPDQGIINIGPVLIQYGSEAQRAKYLPKILSGEHIWCQGYSEPNAGSDLASLRTEAIPDGDEFVVNGQKIWTTLAQDATHIFVLVRTDKTVKKQAGISFLLAELSTPGITVRPIRNIGGEEEFCEVFFDKARVPRENLVGELNQGWTIAKALLDFERIFVGSPSQARYALNQLKRVGDEANLFADRRFADQYANSLLDVEDLQSLYSGYANIVKKGEKLPPSVSLLKIWATEVYSRIAMEVVEASYERGGDAAPWTIGDTQITPAGRLYNASITTIYGGTNEIQRNILAKAVLGLPG